MRNFIKHQTIYESVRQSAKHTPGAIALIYQGKKFSYALLKKRINQYAHKLVEMGFKNDDVITVSLPNIPQAVYLLYAINQIGAIANLIHPLMKREQLEEIIDNVGSKILFTLDINYEQFASLEEKGIKVISVSPATELPTVFRKAYEALNAKKLSFLNGVDKSRFDKAFAGKKEFKKFEKNYYKDSFYLHSGGTTGKSKTIALSNFSLNALAENGLDILCTKKLNDKKMLAVLPMFHGFGLCMGIHALLCYGGTDVLMPKFNTDQTIKYIKKNQLNILIGVPTLYEALLLKKDFKGKKLKNLDVAFVGGDFVSSALIDKFDKRMSIANSDCRLFEGYGLTETVTVLSVNTHNHHKEGTVGRILDNVRVKTKSLETGLDLPEGEPGELYISGETLMNGYRFDSETNNESTFETDSLGKKWIKTGDYGRVDEDKFIYFMQRLKRIIKVNGINIFPSEIENVVASLPYIFECAAVGVNDEVRGEMIKLFVVLAHDYNGEKPVEEINNTIKNRCGVFAVPKEIVFMDSFPKTLVGKIDTKLLK